VNEPLIDPTFVPSHAIVASFIVAPPPPPDTLPPTVAFDFVPLPVASRPLLPGPAACTAGARAATASMLAAANQPARRMVPRRSARDGVEWFIWSPIPQFV
jgi:hypothetical protein